jgi:hypothetical protein
MVCEELAEAGRLLRTTAACSGVQAIRQNRIGRSFMGRMRARVPGRATPSCTVCGGKFPAGVKFFYGPPGNSSQWLWYSARNSPRGVKAKLTSMVPRRMGPSSRQVGTCQRRTVRSCAAEARVRPS